MSAMSATDIADGLIQASAAGAAASRGGIFSGIIAHCQTRSKSTYWLWERIQQENPRYADTNIGANVGE